MAEPSPYALMMHAMHAFHTAGVLAKDIFRAQQLQPTHGPSVSICILPNGISLTTSRFSSVFKLQPLTPMSKPIARRRFISSAVPVKLCTSPFFGKLDKHLPSISSKSTLAARECRNRGSCNSTARSSWRSKYFNCCSLPVRKSRS